jgi:acetyl esterase/lipase
MRRSIRPVDLGHFNSAIGSRKRRGFGATLMMRIALIAFAICLSAAFAACSTGPTTSDEAPTAVLAGPAGSLIQREALPGAPDGAAAYRILYRSTGLNNEPIMVSGDIIVPQRTPPPAGRPIVAWAHPTSGVEPQCAPSLARSFFQQVQGLREMVKHGYVVVATDYQGLGTPETHPYLVGISEGRAVLDSVRAARQMPEAGVGSRFVVWGHSQGGQAALFTGLIAKDDASELTLAGAAAAAAAAAAAPATDLVTLVNDDFNSVGGKNLTAMTLWS